MRDTRRNLRGNLRGDRGFGRKLRLWCAGAVLLLALAVVNLWLRSSHAAPEDVSLNALKDAYAKVVPGETPAPQLASLGFDTGNGGVRRLTYLGLMEYFAPTDSTGFDRLDPAARKCLNTPDGCSAYVFRLARAQGSERQAAFGFVNAAEASNARAVVEVVFLIHVGRVAYKALTGV
jgi:hypothetical protein